MLGSGLSQERWPWGGVEMPRLFYVSSNDCRVYGYRHEKATRLACCRSSIGYILTEEFQQLPTGVGLQSLGERHEGYGLKPEHYPMVGDALLKTFANFFPDH